MQSNCRWFVLIVTNSCHGDKACCSSWGLSSLLALENMWDEVPKPWEKSGSLLIYDSCENFKILSQTCQQTSQRRSRYACAHVRRSNEPVRHLVKVFLSFLLCFQLLHIHAPCGLLHFRHWPQNPEDHSNKTSTQHNNLATFGQQIFVFLKLFPWSLTFFLKLVSWTHFSIFDYLSFRI